MLVLTLLFLLIYAMLLLLYRQAWKKAPAFQLQQQPAEGLLSVIVPARNEEKNILSLLQSLLQQSLDADRFEIIVVDDYSTDDTALVVSSLRSPRIRMIRPQVAAEYSSKKKAIEAGIAAARGDLIVTTDADCIPGPHWLQTLQQFHAEHDACFIAAPVKFHYTNDLLQIFQAVDFIVLQGITAASVSGGYHNMCNGANLAYTKKAFESVNGFAGIDHVATGDDMLLMHKIWQQEPRKVFYLKNREAIVATAPMPTLESLLMQRKRWASKTFVYDDKKIIAVLGFVFLFNLLFLVLIAAVILHPPYWWLLPLYLVGKILAELPFVSGVADFYREKRLLKYFILLQPLHIVFTVWVGLTSQFGKYEWKGRKTK